MSWTRLRLTLLLVIFCGFITFELAQETGGSLSLALLVASAVLLGAEIALGILDHLRSSNRRGVE
ncbi:MAG TPA: hypothetical protein VGR19_02160 [Allosphingosinicella sp.]|nr:hypothetical protein [Allosphingosinicella sp.]